MSQLSFAEAPEASAEAGALTGQARPGLESFDRLLVDFCTQHEIPGGALAVARQGRLVYARGFGWADRETRTPVEPTSLFRVASLSKPVTAAAVMRLVEKGCLSLDAKVHELLELSEPADPRWRKITVEQLLNHTGGWDRDKSFDPMFRSVAIAQSQGCEPPAMPAQVIRHMLDKPLDFAPGERYAYSNFGYCLLGRVIERLAGGAYESYVQEQILAPLGIRRMRLGKTLAAERCEGEVCYYHRRNRQGPSVFASAPGETPYPYGCWCLEAMDAHGGWIGSAIDLVRFASALDRPGEGGSLKEATLASMFRRPSGLAGHDASGEPKAVYYGLGWQVRELGAERRINTWHTGSLDGTAALLVRRHDGLSWCLLFNTRDSAHAPHLGSAVDPLVHPAADAVAAWPEEDLFAALL